MTVRRLLREVDSVELTWWDGYYQIYPFPQDRLEWSFAMLASVQANIHRDSKKKSKPFEPSDFLPKWEKASEKAQAQTQASNQPMDGLTFVEMLNTLFGGQDLREKP
jgi:hypothetical protein